MKDQIAYAILSSRGIMPETFDPRLPLYRIKRIAQKVKKEKKLSGEIIKVKIVEVIG